MSKAYWRSIIALAALFVVGLALQLLLGDVPILLFAWPVSGIAAAVVVLAIVGLSLYRDRQFFHRLTGIPFSVSLIGAWLIGCLAMGLVPQHGPGMGGWVARLGLYSVASSWPFMIIYLILLVSLGCIVVNAVAVSGFRRWGFLLNHTGLWLVLLGAGIGGADFREMTVRIDEGATATHADGRTGAREHMPFAVRLDDFRMEEYPVRWGIVDVRTRKFQPEGKPMFYDTEREAFAANADDGGGGHLLVASTVPEPSHFSSSVTIITPNGEDPAVVEVNHPYRRGSWSLYQFGYDTQAGKESSWSVFQLVRDPWLPVVYAGIAMLAVGALSLFRTKRKKGGRDGVE